MSAQSFISTLFSAMLPASNVVSTCANICAASTVASRLPDSFELTPSLCVTADPDCVAVLIVRDVQTTN